jgi:threonine/homoserine/homoserine lactone efflux protein
MQFLNIKAWMLALTLTAGWVVNAAGQPSTNPGQRLAIICAVMLLFAFTSNFSYALLGSLLRQWLAHGQRLRWFNRLLAVVLLATACWMLAV